MGYKKADDIIGLSDTHIKSEMVELAEQFIAQDNAVIKIGEQQQHLDIGHYPNGELQIHLSTKKPLWNTHNKVIGTIFLCTEIQPTFLSHLYAELYTKQQPDFFEIGGKYVDYCLSHRESECLFFLMRGLTAKEIARRIKLSHKTIESYIERLKNKPIRFYGQISCFSAET